MASIMDLILRVVGNSTQFREDMEQDKAVLEDFVNSVHDINLDINLDDADAKTKLDEFKADLDELHKQTAKINLDDAAAKEKLEAFKVKLDELRKQTVDINLDDADAKVKVDELKMKIDELKKDSIDIKVNDIDAKAKLDALQEKEDRLRDALVNVDVNDSDAKVKIDDIKAKLDAIHDDRIKIKVEDSGAILQIDELDKKLDGLEARIETINHTPIRPKQDNAGGGAGADQGQWGWLAGTILTTLPAISPLAAVAAAAIGSVGGAFAAAAGGAVGFGVVAKANISDVTAAQGKLQAAQQAVNAAAAQVKGAKTYQQWLVATEALQAAQKNLATTQRSIGPSLMSAVNALNQFEARWKYWTASFRPTVLSAFDKALTGIESLMTDMTPVINAAGKAINELLSGLDSDLSGKGASKFFQTLAQTTGPAILAFGQSAGNIFKGLAGIFEAFAPTFGSVEGGLVGLTAKFAAWGQQLGSSNAFKKFLDYVRTEGPQVMSLIGTLATTVMKLLEAMAPGGGVILAVVTELLKLVNALLSVNPLVGQVGVAIVQGIGVMKLLGPVITGVLTAIKWFGAAFLGASEEAGTAILGMSGPIGWIIAAVVAAVILIVTHWKQVSAIAREVWKDVSGFFESLGKDIERIWNGVLKWFDGMWKKLSAFFRKWGPDILLAIAPFIGIPLFIFQHFGEIEKWFSDMWGKVVSGAKSFASNIMDEFKTLGSDVGNFFSNLASEAIQWGENLVNHIADGIKNAASNLKNAVSGIAGHIGNFLGFHSPTKEGPGADADHWMPNLISMMVDGLQAGAPKVRAALNQVILPPGVSGMMQQAGGTFAAAAAGSLESHVHIYGNVYSTDDIAAAAQQGAQKVLGQFVQGVKLKGRTMGVSN